VPFVIWAGVIFFASSDSGSSEHTSRFIRPLLEWIFWSASAETIDLIHLLIRKAAHLTEYGILGVLGIRAVRGLSGATRLASVGLAVLAVLIVASSDEFNQSFNPARTSSVWDVALDVLGGLIGATLYILIFGRSDRKV